MENRSTILIRIRTRDRLKRMGNKAQTYDQLINWLIDLSKSRKYNAGHGIKHSKIFEGTLNQVIYLPIINNGNDTYEKKQYHSSNIRSHIKERYRDNSNCYYCYSCFHIF
jgi:hypothetical protein